MIYGLGYSLFFYFEEFVKEDVNLVILLLKNEF